MADETLARMFWNRVAASGDRSAQLIKDAGGWRGLAWSPVGEAVRQLALGLLALDLTEEAGELTPTKKVRRQIVGEKYHALLESLYA
jgi:long-subunit acyl-CoA synthetase (AMP-forming)